MLPLEASVAPPLGYAVAAQLNAGWLAMAMPNWSSATGLSVWLVPVTFSGVLGLTGVVLLPAYRPMPDSVWTTVTFTLLVTESPAASTIVTEKP